MSKKTSKTKTVSVVATPVRPIQKAECEECGSNIVTAPFVITKTGRILCDPCSKTKITEDQILRRF